MGSEAEEVEFEPIDVTETSWEDIIPVDVGPMYKGERLVSVGVRKQLGNERKILIPRRP